MNAQEIIATNGSNLDAYTEEQRQVVKAYGREEYGMGFADTVRIETTFFDRDAFLDETFC